MLRRLLRGGPTASQNMAQASAPDSHAVAVLFAGQVNDAEADRFQQEEYEGAHPEPHRALVQC